MSPSESIRLRLVVLFTLTALMTSGRSPAQELTLDSLFEMGDKEPLAEEPAATPSEDADVRAAPGDGAVDPRTAWPAVIPQLAPFQIPAVQRLQSRDRGPTLPVRDEWQESKIAMEEYGLDFAEVHGLRDPGGPVVLTADRPLLKEAGRRVTNLDGQAAIEITSDFAEICCRIELVPEDESLEPAVLLLGPETGDAFHLPPGTYRAHCRFWRQAVLREEDRVELREDYPAQELDADTLYRLHLDRKREGEIGHELDAAARGAFR